MVGVRLLKAISRNLREASKNNHHLAIPPHLKQGLDVIRLDYNDSIPFRSHFFYPSHIGFCYPWLIPVLQVGFHAWSKRIPGHQERRYESTYLLLHKR